jgi:hypothetical protein
MLAKPLIVALFVLFGKRMLLKAENKGQTKSSAS